MRTAPSASADVVIVGAGLAGLRCAERIASAGLEVVVLEAGDVVGGRQRTDRVDGFLLDRGFQVLNPAYPAVRRWVDVAGLDLRAFPVGIRVRREGGWAELGHPLRRPRSIPATLGSGMLHPRDVAGFARWLAPALLRPRSVIAGADRTLAAAWDAAGLRGPLRVEVLEPFLAGVLAEDRGTTSDAFARLLVRMFALGAPGVPAAGIGALPQQLAARARATGADIRTGARVVGIDRRQRGRRRRVRIAGARSLSAGAVVVAVGPGAVAGLLDVPAPATRGLQTWWFAADAPPAGSGLLVVDGRRAGPIVNSVAMTRTAPSYAPPGRHLVQATALLPRTARADPAAAPSEPDIRRHLAELWGASASDWRLLRRDDVHDALPAQSPPLRTTSPARLDDGLYVAGDHRDTASIQGALVSGDRVGRAVLRDLGIIAPRDDGD
ncbi:FAD-dependent oxidoreductase [Agromyces sp. SYSU T0242]|uniref:FAD-dependent oxidoreductase n=1 Tax=Agromyces litoreus TaxID=3158561 RepID=UPI0033913200